MQVGFYISTYLSHLFKSFHLHGIHSPFVFQFEKKCLRDTKEHEGYLRLSRFRESLNNNNTVLTIKDHGAGSRVFKSDQREINKILKHNCSSEKIAKMLYRVAQYFSAKRILEFGTSLGVATHAMATANPDAEITTVEGSDQIAEFSRTSFENNGLKNTTVINATFQEYLDGKADTSPVGTYDIIYLDGHHSGEATISYFEQLLEFTHNDTVFILDDIYWSQDMKKAWNKLIHHDKVSASINIYDLGFLFLRIEQPQQSFHIYV